MTKQKEIENGSFLKDPNHCRGEWFLLRDSALIESVRGMDFEAIFEFAGASGLLAEVFLLQHPGTKYLLSDYSPEACRLARQNLVKFPEASVEEVDIVNDLDKVSWHDFDLVISTSMEHLPKGADLEIVKRIRSGAQVLFCLAAFGGTTHPHHYPSKEYIVERFSPLIEIKQLLVMLFPRATTYYNNGHPVGTENFVFLLYGERL